MTLEASSRGFMHGPEIPCTYGGNVRAYESSSAEGPKIWVNIHQSPHIDYPAEDRSAVVHLALDGAEALRDQLTELIDHAKESWEEEAWYPDGPVQQAVQQAKKEIAQEMLDTQGNTA